MTTAEQQARDLLERLDVTDAQQMTAGDLAELANLIAEHAAQKALLMKFSTILEKANVQLEQAMETVNAVNERLQANQQTWYAAIAKAATSARDVFSESCSHTKQGIDFMEQVLVKSVPMTTGNQYVQHTWINGWNDHYGLDRDVLKMILRQCGLKIEGDA